MKRKFYLVITCALLSVGSSVILQAMQEQELAEEQSVLTSPTAKNEFYYNLILKRIKGRNFKEALDILDRALERGYDINYRGGVDGFTLLSLVSGDIDLTKALLKAEANPNIQNNSGFAPLHLAVTRLKAPLIISELIKHRANVNIKSDKGKTPLMTAIILKQIPAIKTLLTIPDIDIMAKDDNEQTAFDFAKRSGDPEIINLLKPHYMKLKDICLDYIKKHKGEFTGEQLKQRLCLDVLEELQES